MMIRTAVSTDEAAVRDCAIRAFQRHVSAIGRKPAPMEADVAHPIASGQVQVATGPGGSLLGFILFYPEAGHMQLETVAVQPEAAGRGIGKALIGVCEDEARRQGLGSVRLYTNLRMTENLIIYPRLGYKEVARRREDGFDRVFYEKRLA